VEVVNNALDCCKSEALRKNTKLKLLRWMQKNYKRFERILSPSELKEFHVWCETLHMPTEPWSEITEPGRYEVLVCRKPSRYQIIVVIDLGGELHVKMDLTGHTPLRDCVGILKVLSHVS